MNRQPSALPTNLWDLNRTTDEILNALHVEREAYAAHFDYDVQRIFEDLTEKESNNPGPFSDLKPVHPSRHGD